MSIAELFLEHNKHSFQFLYLFFLGSSHVVCRVAWLMKYLNRTGSGFTENHISACPPYFTKKKSPSLSLCLFCFTYNSCFPYYCILVSWTKWQGQNAIRTETIITGDNNSNNSNNNSRSSGFSNPMPLQRPALWQRTQVFQSRHFQICSKGF